ncbi:MAG TPA: hypothetical protein VFX16_28760 [Pseudonocardiaceae bacterium]|nr:hypothetical protein [Pseudonocardiaceae bacterium]
MNDAAAGWELIPSEVRDRIDDLLRRRSHLQAIRVLVQQQALSLSDAQQISGMRFTTLHDRGEIEPLPEITIESLLAPARALAERIVAIEAYWDGDSFGWHAALVAIIERPSQQHSRFDEVHLGLLGQADTDDIATARAVAEALGVPFHFTQPERADIDLPRWWDTTERDGLADGPVDEILP